MSTQDHIHGPSLWKWMMEEKRIHPDTDLTHNMARRVRGWREGDHPSIWTVDAVLTYCGHHLSEVPDEFYRPTRRTWKMYPPEVKAKALAEMRTGRRASDIARELGCSSSTVIKWRSNNRRAGDSTLDAVASPGLREGG